MAKWLLKKKLKNVDLACKVFSTAKPLALSLAARKIRTYDEAENYISNSDFANIDEMTDVVKAYKIIENAIKNEKSICIYGDYDADGVCSTTIMCKALSFLGAEVTYFIPDRVEDGYGLSDSSVVNIAQAGVSLIITCDNGIAAYDQVELAKKLGLEIIVLDHHEPPIENGTQIIPRADAVVDAKINDCGYPFSLMCAGGLCYRFSKGLFNYLNEDFSEIDDELLGFAGIATVCDVVDLIGENRTIVKNALEILNNKVENAGLRSLLAVKEIDTLNTYRIGFIVGPCINASGRLDSASIAVDLFLTEDENDAYQKAVMLSNINEERKTMTAEGIELFINKIGENPKDKILVEYNSKIHESIAGIIAGRLKEYYHRPAIVFTDSGDVLKGSGRSIEQYNLFEALSAQKKHLYKFGGHAMAAGLSILPQNFETLKNALNESCDLTEDDLVEIIRVDGILNIEDITIESIEELDRLEPFGVGNPKPVYAVMNVAAMGIRLVGKEKRMVSFVARDAKGYEVRCIDFNNYEIWENILSQEGYTMDMASRAVPIVDILVQLDINEFNGNRNVSLNVRDVRKSKKSQKK